MALSAKMALSSGREKVAVEALNELQDTREKHPNLVPVTSYMLFNASY